MAKYEKNVYIAMLAEQCNRFEEMIEFLEDMLKNRDKDLSSDERNLLSIAYKNSISSRRTALRTIMAYEMKEKKKENSTFLPYILEYRKKVEEELTKTCYNVLSSIDTYLLKRAEDDEGKVFYLKMKGDYNRYIAEYAQGDLKDKTGKDALNSYKQASEHAKGLSTIHPIALGLALNFSVFYYEVMNDHETACRIAKETLDGADKELPGIDEDDEAHRDAMSIINLLRENLEMWKIEAEDDK
jgi:14-3-3 protein epsilon